MKLRVFGKIVKVNYQIRWSSEDTFSQHIENPEEYIKEYEELVEYIELNEKVIIRGKSKCSVINTIVDLDKNEVLLYTDYIAKTINKHKLEKEKEKKINELVKICNDQIKKYDAQKNCHEEKMIRKWYTFWK